MPSRARKSRHYGSLQHHHRYRPHRLTLPDITAQHALKPAVRHLNAILRTGYTNSLRRKIQLGILFSIGFVVVTITILRLPLILSQSVTQRARSTVKLLSLHSL